MSRAHEFRHEFVLCFDGSIDLGLKLPKRNKRFMFIPNSSGFLFILTRSIEIEHRIWNCPAKYLAKLLRVQIKIQSVQLEYYSVFRAISEQVLMDYLYLTRQEQVRAGWGLTLCLHLFLNKIFKHLTDRINYWCRQEIFLPTIFLLKYLIDTFLSYFRSKSV